MAGSCRNSLEDITSSFIASDNNSQPSAGGGETGQRCNSPFVAATASLKCLYPFATKMSIIFLVLICHGMRVSLFAPFFPDEAIHKGMTATSVGILFSFYQIVMFIGLPIAGKSVSHFGVRYMIWAGMLLAGGATLLFGIVDLAPNGTTYIALCFAVRFVEAIGTSLYFTAVYSIAGCMFQDNIAFVYSLLEASIYVGSVIGPGAGGFLYDAAGFYLPFVTVGSIVLISGFLSSALLLHDHNKAKSAANGKIPVVVENPTSSDKLSIVANRPRPIPWSRLFRRKETWVVAFSYVIGAIIYPYPEPTLSIYLEELGLHDKAVVGSIFLASSVACIIVPIPVARIADRYPDKVYLLMSSGAILTAFSFVIMGPAPPLSHFVIRPSIATTAACLFVANVGLSLLMVPVSRAFTNIAKDVGFSVGLETSAMVASLYNSLWFLGGFSGTILAGFLLESVGFRWGATIMAGTSLVPAPILVILNHFITRTN